MPVITDGLDLVCWWTFYFDLLCLMTKWGGRRGHTNIHMCGASIVNEKKRLNTFCKDSWSIWQRIAIIMNKVNDILT